MGKDTQQKTTVLTQQHPVGDSPHISRQFSAGGIVFRKVNDGILWLVARNAPSDIYPDEIWRLQKGWIDDGEKGDAPGPIASGKIKATEEQLQTGAIREVREEGGVIAKIIKKIGTSKYYLNLRTGKILKFVTFYLMEYIEDAPEGFCFETSEVLWLPIELAVEKITFKNEKEILKKASELLVG